MLFILTVTNPIAGSITGNAATVTTNANLTGEVTSSGNATTVTNAAVIGKVLTGYTAGAGTVAATDNILQAIHKVDGNVAAATSGKQNTLTNSAGLAGALSDETGSGKYWRKRSNSNNSHQRYYRRNGNYRCSAHYYFCWNNRS